MRRASGRRTASCGNGRAEERARASRPTSVTRAPICSAPSVPPAASARRWRCLTPTPRRCSFISRRSGSRPRQPADQRYESAYLFGAICPARGVGAALALPHANTEAMQLHLEEISAAVAVGAHAVLIFDRAGWHTTPNLLVPENITPIWLPSRAPELNPVENIWQYLRANWLSNRVFETFDDIIDAICDAWNKLTAEPEIITSIGMRNWAHIGQSK